jgi:hypothetical protein
MKRTFIILAIVALFHSCISVDHEFRKYNAKGLAYKYGYYMLDNKRREFYQVLEGRDIENKDRYVQLSDTTWRYVKNGELFSCTCLYVTDTTKTDLKTMSVDGYDTSDEYVVHFFTTDPLVLVDNYIGGGTGTVRVEVLKDNNQIGWSEIKFKPDSINHKWYSVTSGYSE